jgi:hypothetical protein
MPILISEFVSPGSFTHGLGAAIFWRFANGLPATVVAVFEFELPLDVLLLLLQPDATSASTPTAANTKEYRFRSI